MLQIVLLVLAVVVVAILALAASKPNTFRVRRSEQIQAPPDRLFALIQDFHKWVAWSPWEKRDPALQRTYSGPADGRGAIYEWTGNKEVGSGRMEILTATPTSIVGKDFEQGLANLKAIAENPGSLT